MANTRKIRWVLAHEPIELFIRAAKTFVKELEQTAPDSGLEFEIMTLSEYADKYQEGEKVTKHDLLALMEQNEIEMSQMYTTWLGEAFYKDMHVLDMPFLFKDHDHAARILEGEVGKDLLAGLSKASNMRGLAFTYSGGFRMIPADRKIEKIEDFQGLKIRANRSPVAMDTIAAVGAEPVKMELEDIKDAVVDGRIVGGESTYPRFYGLNQHMVCDYINDTKHSLFLTCVLVNETFWESLDADLQAKMTAAAVTAARHERKISVDDVKFVREKAAQDGIEVVDLPDSEVVKFKAATEGVYKKYEPMFGSYINKIQKG